MAATDELGEPDLAGVAAALGDARRIKILSALADGKALPASRLATEAGVSASTVSTHLAGLLAHGLVRVEPQGRFRYYRLAGDDVEGILEALARVAPRKPVNSLRDHTRGRAADRPDLLSASGRPARRRPVPRAAPAGLGGRRRRPARPRDRRRPAVGAGPRRPVPADRRGRRGTGRARDRRRAPPTLHRGRSRCATAWTGPSSGTISPARSAPRSPTGCSSGTGSGAVRSPGASDSPDRERTASSASA